MKNLVLGLGNLLLGDEGVGVHAARALVKEGCPEDVTVLDIGTAILDALEAIEQAERIVVVDAVMAEDGVPGAVYRMPLDAFESPRSIASMHGFDLSRVLKLTGRIVPPEVVVIGVQPAKMDWSLELSPVVAEALPGVIEVLRREIAA